VDLVNSVLVSTLNCATPLLFAALGGLVAQRAGVLNIGIEGMMLIGAFAALVVSHITGNVGVALFGGIVASSLLALVFCLFTITLRANPIVVGLALNIGATGLVGYILPLAFSVQGTFRPSGLQVLERFTLTPLSEIPLFGALFTNHTFLVYLSWLCVPLVAFLLHRTVWGIRLRAVGEGVEAAHSAGIHTAALQYSAVLFSAVFASLAGAQLSIGELSLFSKEMTAGRGFIALAAFYFGSCQPWPTAWACLLFGFFEAIQYRLQLFGIPPQIVQMIPYLSVVVTLTLVQVRKYRSRLA
jgi:simple sugar transport system permease protein